MAQKVAEEKRAEQEAAKTGTRPKSGKLLLIVGLMVVIITVQVVITYLLMPKATDPKAEDGAAAKPVPAAAAKDAEPAAADNETVEQSLGDFNCTNSTANPGMVVNIDFKLIAVTAAGNQSALKKALEQHTGRVRQMVNQIVRRSSLEDLNDPNLSTIKRLIRQELNKLLRTTIDEVVISDVRTMDQ